MNEIDQDPPSQFFVSTDAALLDVVWITRTIQQTYFGAWRSDAVILRSLAPPSICFGLYESATSKQVGFARGVSDCATFSWLCDVVIDKELRGKGLGSFLMARVIRHDAVKGTACRLATRNSMTFYAKLGFESCKDMRRLPTK